MKTTTDIYLAAAFLSLGAKLDKTDKSDPRHMIFQFSSPTTTTVKLAGQELQTNVAVPMDLDTLENQWVNRTLMVNAFEFAEALKRMKSLVHSH